MIQPPVRCAALLLAFALLLPPLTSAFGTSLSEENVRDAYFLGRNGDVKTAFFLGNYLSRFPGPEKGPYVSEIQLLTPYAQVVEQSWMNQSMYSAQQAEFDYRRRGDFIRVSVMIYFTMTYGLVEVHTRKDHSGNDYYITGRKEDFWKDFGIQLTQDGKKIEPRDVRADPLYSDSGLWGARVWLRYNVQDVAAEDSSFEVVTPDGQHVVATFDLAKLR